MAKAFPGCDTYTLWRDKGAEAPAHTQNSWLARTPLTRSKALSLPLMPVAWRTATRQTYDVLLSSSHAFGHHFRSPTPESGQWRLSYVHSPARYVWSPELDARGDRASFAAAAKLLRRVDAKSAMSLHGLAANSKEVAARIERYWGREAVVINPPVEVSYFTRALPTEYELDLPENYILGASRWIPYKRLDLVLEAGARLGRPVVLAGAGPEEKRLRSRAKELGELVTFVPSPSRWQLRELYSRASVYCFPAHEDFGMMPLEAQSCGAPVAALAAGGSLETVKDGITGALADEATPEAFAEAIERAESVARVACVAWAQGFSPESFRSRMRRWVTETTGIPEALLGAYQEDYGDSSFAFAS